MSDERSYLLILTDGNELLRIALKVKINMLSEEEILYYEEKENKEKIKQLLPEDIRDWGKVVEIQQIFDVEDKT